MALSDAIERLQGHANAVMHAAHPTYPPEAQGAARFSVSYEVQGEYKLQSAGFALDFPTVVLEMHIPRNSLPTDVKTAMTYRVPFCQLLRDDPTLDSTVQTINAIRYRFGRLGEGEEADIGYRFEIDLKMNG